MNNGALIDERAAALTASATATRRRPRLIPWWARSAGVFLLCLGFVPLTPYISLLGYSLFGLSLEFLFFLPQLAFPYNALGAWEGDAFVATFDSHAAVLVTPSHWGIALLVFVFASRRISRMPRLFLTSLATILIVTIAANALFHLLGLSVELDGL